VDRDIEAEKQMAAEAAVSWARPGMSVGLGTGTTVEYLLPALARHAEGLRCVSTSPRTEELARGLGISVESFSGPAGVAHLDLAIDGADQVDPQGWLVKGGGAAHTREKRVAASADVFIVIVSSNKIVNRLTAPIPLELLDYGLAATLRDLREIGDVQVRDAPRSPDGGVIADYLGPVDDPQDLSLRLAALPGVVEHGLFPPSMVTTVLIGRGDFVEQRDVARRP